MKNFRVLVVGGEESQFEVVARTLGGEWEVVPARTLVEARRRLRESIFDAAVLDSRLPDGEVEALFEEGLLEGIFSVVLLDGPGRLACADASQCVVKSPDALRQLPYYLRAVKIREDEKKKRAEKALVERTAYLESILRGSTDMAIATTDLDLRVTYYNPMAERLLGYSEKDVIGKSLPEIHSRVGIGKERFQEVIQEVKEKGEHRFTVERVTGEGKRYIDARIADIRNTEGVLLGYAFFATDVTESRKAQQAISLSEKTWRDTFDSMVDGVAIDTPDFIVEKTNQAFRELLGLQAEDIEGKKCYEVIHGTSSPIARCPVKRCLETGRIERLKIEFKGRHLSVVASPIIENGEIVRVVHVFRDVTKEKQAVAALKRQLEVETALGRIATTIASNLDFQEMCQRVLKEVVDLFQADFAIFLEPCPDGKSCHVKAAVQKDWMDGLDEIKIPVHPILEAVKEDGIAAIPDIQETGGELEAGLGIPGVRGLLAHATRGETWILALGTHTRREWTGKERKIFHTIAHHLKVAVQRFQLQQETLQAFEDEKKLNSLAQQLQTIFNLKKGLELIARTNSEITGASRSEIFLYNPQDETLSLAAGYPPRDEQVKFNRETLPDAFKAMESRTPQKGEGKTDSNCFYVPILVKGLPRGVLSVHQPPQERQVNLTTILASYAGNFLENAELFQDLREITLYLEEEVKARTQQLEEANRRLKELDRLKNIFIATTSHELRTPLTSIIGFSKLLLEDWAKGLTKEQQDMILNIHHAGERLLALVNDIIDISKIEAGKIEAKPEKFQLEELIAEATATIKPEIQKKNLTLKIDIPSQVTLYTDRQRLHQCVLNLLDNAAKYTETGGITITAKDLGDWLEISITDTGIGIKKEDLPRLFTPFNRIETHLTQKTPGTGLGLYLVKKLTENILQGETKAQSKWGEGSTFTLKIPREIRRQGNPT